MYLRYVKSASIHWNKLRELGIWMTVYTVMCKIEGVYQD
jgi:hypothetical protein